MALANDDKYTELEKRVDTLQDQQQEMMGQIGNIHVVLMNYEDTLKDIGSMLKSIQKTLILHTNKIAQLKTEDKPNPWKAE